MPQLNPEFFISQLFWLVITFTFLFIFLWRISLPRISSVLEKREYKINEDIALAKKLQAETEEIQHIIDAQLKKAKLETADMIKVSSLNFQNYANKELLEQDNKLSKNMDEVAKSIEKNRTNSLNTINEQIYEITKLTLSKISNITVNESEIKETVASVQQKVVN